MLSKVPLIILILDIAVGPIKVCTGSKKNKKVGAHSLRFGDLHVL